jgi:hypothetical protein
MIIWKGYGSKWLLPDFKVLSQNVSAGSEENDKTFVRIAGLRI